MVLGEEQKYSNAGGRGRATDGIMHDGGRIEVLSCMSGAFRPMAVAVSDGYTNTPTPAVLLVHHLLHM